MLGHRKRSTLYRARASVCAVAVGALLWAIVGTGTAAAHERAVTVMTQNLYQGTEFKHFAALQGKKVSFKEALEATTADYGTYLATRFKDRAKQIAAAIAQNEPALVGLQEVATWHAGPFNEAHPFALPAPLTEDFTQELIGALAADGVQYAVASRRDNNFTLAFPIFTSTGLVAVGMVESGVILARADLPPGQLKLSNPQSGTYNARIPPIANSLVPSEPFVFTNSWQSIDAKVRGSTFRFITTHLDALAPGGFVSGPQAQELLKGPANTSLPVIVAGDMNSGTVETPAAYKAFLAGGLSDTWTAAGLGQPPLTCCHLAPEDRSSDPNDTFTENPDHIFSRGEFSVLDEHLVGNKVPLEQQQGGNVGENPPPGPFIWPSDHAGMVATLAIG